MPDTRVYGNQHGTWVEFSGALADQIDSACRTLGVTAQEFVDRALAHYLEGFDEPQE